jgi:RNA polymerase sigma-70 factor (ECF subfamily)
MRKSDARAIRPIGQLRPVNAPSDQYLIDAIAKGSQSAMRSLYARHNMQVYRFILRIVADTARAEDLVSEVFIDVWSQAGRFEGRSQVSTWILSIARFKALTAIHRRQEVALDEGVMELVEDTADTPEETVLKEDRSAQLRSCLGQMSREHREVIDLVYYHEKSVDEVAEITRLPKNTVKTRMFYARKRLAQLLSHHRDFDYLATAQAA